ncbi:MAG: hypothetical protein DRP91_06110 [Candidatus Neomarinimicrobiota bacterium]|nr:MAG: hypothetical protein DRP91_06110 [Candidatus Neomarinimicrobiota bacterium]RKY50458.1 MAG: hypothetical protein DRP92_07900 [Candidatus Neomarinimicrobiota bacterium]
MPFLWSSIKTAGKVGAAGGSSFRKELGLYRFYFAVGLLHFSDGFGLLYFRIRFCTFLLGFMSSLSVIKLNSAVLPF